MSRSYRHPAVELAATMPALAAFCLLLETEMNAETERSFGATGNYPGLNAGAIERGFRGYNEIGCDFGGRFVRVWTANGNDSKSVRYFVEVATGIIYGARGWKAYNPVRAYGSLDTTAAYSWGGYYAVPRDASVPTLVPSWERA